MTDLLKNLLTNTGLGETLAGQIAQASAIASIFILAAVAFVLAKWLLPRAISAISRRTATTWDDKLVEHRVFFWVAHLAPAIIIYWLAPQALIDYELWSSVVVSAAQVYMIVVSMLAIDALLNSMLAIYQSYEMSRSVPLRGFFQVAKILLYLFAVILIIALLLGKSPIYLLGSMGLLASVLMLVFKDPILGLVGGIQLVANRMLAEGDWIEMPSHQADGDVIEVALTTVKVQNWDKTITTIPTYSLISSPFKNWRGMSESGGRRIKRSINIDISSVKLCTPEMLERFAKIQYIADYIERKRKQLAEWNAERGIDMNDPINARNMTNVGTFRAYILAYLENHPEINQDMTLLVRQLEPGPTGLPIQIYCFSKDTRWASYERIQADIFDHLLAVAQEFDLSIYQSPTGSDFRALS
ncbi:MAG: mechanosensitive ion channel family protein [Gammaproteobacteria bacterium]|nr:mechanosensitive ion channel family protein [Gammaproteobacteria bacterium]